jgi:hypothetical protein
LYRIERFTHKSLLQPQSQLPVGQGYLSRLRSALPIKGSHRRSPSSYKVSDNRMAGELDTPVFLYVRVPTNGTHTASTTTRILDDLTHTENPNFREGANQAISLARHWLLCTSAECALMGGSPQRRYPRLCNTRRSTTAVRKNAVRCLLFDRHFLTDGLTPELAS